MIQVEFERIIIYKMNSSCMTSSEINMVVDISYSNLDYVHKLSRQESCDI